VIGTGLLLILVPLLIAVVALAWPLVGRRTADEAADSSIAILKDQLEELERDERRGLLEPAQAKAARLEVERRILKAAAAEPRRTELRTTGLGRALVMLALLAVPAGSAALYLRLGAPGMADLPLASRAAEETPGGIGRAEIEAMVEGLAERLEIEPDDAQGWLMLGRSQLTLGRQDAAVDAYRQAVELMPDDSDAVAGLADALLQRAMGVVTPEVSRTMQRLAELNPGDPRPLYYAGLADAQAGDYHGALERWRILLEASPADAPWRAQIEPSVRQAARSAGIDPEPILALAATPSPEAERARELAAMSPEERSAQIHAMVESLAARLQSEGGSVEEWQRLGRSYLVMGERDKAEAALRQGLAQNPDDPLLNKELATTLLEAPADGADLPVIPDAALPYLEKALAQAPDDPELHWYLGIRALADGNPDDTREHWQKVLTQLDPTTPEHALVQSRLDLLSVN
jgi:cytochrome c-type biogenesis protein CcmH